MQPQVYITIFTFAHVYGWSLNGRLGTRVGNAEARKDELLPLLQDGTPSARCPNCVMGTFDEKEDDKMEMLALAYSSPIQYKSEIPWPEVEHYTIQFENFDIKLEINHGNHSMGFRCEKKIPTKEQKMRLKSFSNSDHLRTRLPLSDHYGMIARLAEYIAEAPEGQTMSSNTFNLDGIKCLHEFQLAKARWTGSGGPTDVVEKIVLVGSRAGPHYGCQGKCGAGCKNLGFYTQNCLDHDQCSYDCHSRFLFLDKNCGDEYVNAAPDFIMGAAMCQHAPNNGPLLGALFPAYDSKP